MRNFVLFWKGVLSFFVKAFKELKDDMVAEGRRTEASVKKGQS
jgi:hypothetical protein